MKGRILLAESSPGLAENLRILISTVEGFRLVGQSTSGLDAMRKMTALTPDVLILDLSLPDMNAVQIVRWAARLFPDTKVILLSSHDLPEYRLAAARLKATTFVAKTDLYHTLSQALVRLRREEMAREGEQGAILVARCVREVRGLPAWMTRAARARNQLPMWRFIHAGVVVLSLELLGGTLFSQQQTQGPLMLGWVLILAALFRDVQTLRKYSGLRLVCASQMGDNHA